MRGLSSGGTWNGGRPDGFSNSTASGRKVELALYSSGDLNPVERFLIRLHVRYVRQMRRHKSDSFNVTSSVLRSQMTKMPQGVEWDRLAAEMTANIHLGLEAGECVGPVRAAKVERIGWRAAIVMAGLSVVLAGAWLLNPPRRAENARCALLLLRSELRPAASK